MPNPDFSDEDDELPIRKSKRPSRDVDDDDDSDRPRRRRGCVECGSKEQPAVIKKLSGGGWAMFVVLLLVCFPICWIPFVIDSFKESKRARPRWTSRRMIGCESSFRGTP